MAVDAVFPAASELVMLYAGALAAGAFSGQHVVLFGDRIDSHFWAYVAMSFAGTIGYTLGSLVGWGIGAYAGRPLLEERGRWFHLDRAKLDRADRWFERWGDWAVFLGRLTPVVRSFISIPAGVVRMPIVRFTVLTFLGSAIWCFAIAGVTTRTSKAATRPLISARLKRFCATTPRSASERVFRIWFC